MKILPYVFAAKDKVFSHGIRLYHGTFFYRYAVRLLKPSFFSDNIVTTLEQETALSRASHIVDEAIEQLLNKEIFTPKKILAIIDPYRFAPLTALLVFNTKEVCRVRVTVQDSNGYRYEGPEGVRHRIPVMQLRAGKKNRILVEVICKTEILFSRTIVLRTCPLPEMIENMVVVKNHRKKSAIPLTFVYGGDTKFPYAFDENGEIRYYLSRRPKAYGLFPLSGGRFLFLNKNICNPSFSNPHAVLAYEMDFLGRVYHQYYIPDGIHHDGCEMGPGGNILTISSSLKQYVEDTIIEIDRKTGQIVKKLCLETILSEHPYFDYFDWAHINTISWLPEDHSILLCARNLHSVIKIDWVNDELLWIFCDTSFWADTPYADKVLTPCGETPFCYQAHAAYFLPEFSSDGIRKLIIFDNHWHARRPVESFDNDKLSHVRIYEIDERVHTIKLDKDYGCPKTKIRANAIPINNRIFAMCGFLNKKAEDHAGMILEFDRETGKTVNRYLTYNSFYRAYPFFADYDKAALPMKPDENSFLCSGETLFECKMPPTEQAKPLHVKNLSRRKQAAIRRGPDKFERIREYRRHHEELDYKEDLSEIQIRFYDELLLIGCRDHLLEYVYLAGKEHCFGRDYTNTEQKSPALFERSQYYLSIPVHTLPPDTYEIYVRCRGELYDTGCNFTLKPPQCPCA